MSVNRIHKVRALTLFMKDHLSGEAFTYESYVEWMANRGYTMNSILSRMEFAHWIRRVVRSERKLGWFGWLSPWARIEHWVEIEKIFSRDYTTVETGIDGSYTENPLGVVQYTVYTISLKAPEGEEARCRRMDSTL